jgi:flagellar biosynthesis protein FlhB
VSNDAEKPFEATPQRLQKAKREGNVARSAELTANISFAAAAATLASTIAIAGARLSDAVARASSSGTPPWSDAGVSFGITMLPMAAAACAGVVAAALQSGGIAIVPVTVKAERLDVVAGLRRLLSGETAGHALRAACAFAVAVCAIWMVVERACAQLLRARGASAYAAAAWHGVCGAAIAACACGLVFAIAEYASARRVWLRKLRMSFDERKREAKEQEGDPHTRGRRRALHRSLLRGAPSEVKNASFVVVNPTHVAVALRYVPAEMPAPVALVAAAGEAALRVREFAVRSCVPIVEDPPLARALFSDVVIGAPIPLEHYTAVAEVVAALSRDLHGYAR